MPRRERGVGNNNLEDRIACLLPWLNNLSCVLSAALPVCAPTAPIRRHPLFPVGIVASGVSNTAGKHRAAALPV